MGDFAPAGYALAFLLFIGLIFPFFLGFFIEVGDVQLNPFTTGLIDVIENGVSIFTFEINPFSWLGAYMQNQLLESVIYLSLLPTFIIIPAIILSIVSIFYTLIKMLPTT